ncbi:MAG: hypothetical protein ACOX0Z_00975 [Candidatus Nanosyncoccaceae bacterium]|jgi:hypothetical protein
MKNLTKIGLATIAIAGVVGLVATNAFAGNQNQFGSDSGRQRQGNGQGYQKSLESRAKVFGISTDELKQALEARTMSQIAKEKGMSEDAFRAKMAEQARKRWAERGLSEEEIAKRIADREKRQAENQANCDGFGSGSGNRTGGYGKNRR